MITACATNYAGLIACRFLLGCLEGMLYPANLQLGSPVDTLSSHYPLFHDDRQFLV